MMEVIGGAALREDSVLGVAGTFDNGLGPRAGPVVLPGFSVAPSGLEKMY